MLEIRGLGPRVMEGLRDVRRAEVLVRGRCLRVGAQVLDHCRGGAQKMLSSAVAEAIVASSFLPLMSWVCVWWGGEGPSGGRVWRVRV